LARAFVDDPLIRALMPPGESLDTVRRMTGLFGVILRGHRGSGQPTLGIINDGQVAAAAIVEQVARPQAAASVVLHGLPLVPELLRALGWNGFMRALSLLDTLTRNRPPEPHIYLNILGVEPVLQRRHFGSAILDFLREQALLRGEFAGVYLETATEANVAYYSRFGYRVLSEIYPLGVRVWRMLQPRSL